MKLLFTALAVSMSACPVLYAQQQTDTQTSPSQSNTIVETISIAGARTPLSDSFIASAISVIDSELIASSGAISITELLRTVPSVNISQSGPMGTLSEIRFRGSESNHILVMIDGVEINDLGQGGLIDLSHILLAHVERIEILRGPQSALWGSAALAGVINIITRSAGKDGIGNLGLSYGNKNSKQLQGAYSSRYKKWRYSISAAYFDTDGENIAREGNESDAYQNTSAYAKLGYDFSQYHRVNLHLRMVDYSSDFDATDFSTGLVADADNVSKGEQLSFGADWDYGVKDSIWSQRLSYQYSEQENKNFASKAFSGSTKGEKHRLIYNHNLKLSQGHINLGIETVDEHFEQAGPIVFGDPNQRQSNNSVSFISDAHHRLSKRISVAGSYRFDNNQQFDDAASYRLGVNLQINDYVRSYFSYAKAIKNPTFTERFGFFPGTFLGNADLNPESSRSVEWGIDANWQRYELQLAWFKAKLKDEILGFVFDPSSALFTAQNATQNSQREGLELELSHSLHHWQWSLSYAYLDATEGDATEANAIELRRAKHSGSAWLSYDINQQHQIFVQADYTGHRFDRFFPPFPANSEVLSLNNYWLLAANYRYKLNQNTLLSLRLSNALDQEFEDVIGFSGESRRALLSLAYSW